MRVDAGVGEWNTTHGTRWRGREWDLPGATAGDATAAILKLNDGLFHQGRWLIFGSLMSEVNMAWSGGELVRGRDREIVVERQEVYAKGIR
jgi:hypothetical protein